MAHIIERKRKDGSIAYLAQISIKRKDKYVYRESRTLDSRKMAKIWLAKRLKEIDMVKGDFSKLKARHVTLGDAIDRYVLESLKEIGRTKAQVLNSIKEDKIAGMRCGNIDSDDLVAYARRLVVDRAPSTVANYMSHLGAVFAIARPAWKIDLDEQAMRDAFKVCARLGITSKSRKRDRRPTLDELDQILTYFEEKHANWPKSMPMHKVIGFALFSTRRQDEITRIQWSDLEHENGRVLVRDMKHPGQKIGNNVWCDLPDPAMRIACSMPASHAEIFPFNRRTISTHFTRACQVLAIDDLRFHDLRHEGVTRLFELGYTIPLAASVSGHRAWSSLQRYTHINQVGDKYADWEWIDRLAV